MNLDLQGFVLESLNMLRISHARKNPSWWQKELAPLRERLAGVAFLVTPQHIRVVRA